MNANETRALRIYEKMGEIRDGYILDAEIPSGALLVPAPRFGGLRRFLNSGWGVAAVSLAVALAVLMAVIRAGQNPPPVVTDVPTDTFSDELTEAPTDPDTTAEPESDTEPVTEDTEPESVRYLEYSEYVPVEPPAAIRWGSPYEDESFRYASNGDGTCTVIAWLNPDGVTDMVIPTHSPLGEPVVRISEYFVMNRGGITSIRIPATVRECGRYAFETMRITTLNGGSAPILSVYGEGSSYVENNCLIDPATKTLILGFGSIPDDGSVTRLGAYSMRCISEGGIPACITYVGMGALGEYWWRYGTAEHEGGVYIGSAENPYQILVEAKEGVTSLSVHPDTKIIYGSGELPGDSMEYPWYFTKLTEITLPEGLVQIAGTAFLWSKLTSIHIPSTVTHIDAGAFVYCWDMESITVSSQNPVYRVNQNCLIEVPTSTLIKPCDPFDLPHDGSILRIGDYAFYEYYNDSDDPRAIILPDSVTHIGRGAFDLCFVPVADLPKNLQSIGLEANIRCNWESGRLPEGLVSVESEGFYGSSGVKLSEIPLPDSLEYMHTLLLRQFFAKSTEAVIPKGMTELLIPEPFDGSPVSDVYIHKDVRIIGADLVGGMTKSARIHYDGTVDEWNALLTEPLNLEDFGGNTLTVICTNGEIQLK